MRFWIISAGLLGLALAGCGSHSDPQSQSQPPSASSTATTTGGATTAATTTSAQRGPIAKRIGDQAGAGCHTPSRDQCDIVYRITKITNCTGGYAGDPPPAGTHRKLVWIEIQTGPNYDTAEVPSYLITQFAAIDGRGVTTGGDLNPSASWECAPKKDRIGFGDENWLPNKRYAGAIEIYLPDDATKITNGDGFWEWVLI